MNWDGLLPQLQMTMMSAPKPAMLIIQLSGNDLVSLKQAKLMRKINRDIKYIASIFKTYYIMWSDILPRTTWRGMLNTKETVDKMNSKRKRVNRAGRHDINELPYGRSIIHEIDIQTGGFFCLMGFNLLR